MKNMRMLKLYISIIFLSFVFWACQEPFDYYVDYKENFVVIEALLTNEYKQQELRLTYSIKASGQDIEPIVNAVVWVETDNVIYDFIPSDSLPGLYVSSDKFIAAIDKTYKLNVIVNDNFYTASTNVLPVSLIDTIRLGYSENLDLYYLEYVAPIFDPFHSAMYIVYLDWSSVQGYENMPYDSTHAKMYFYTLRTMDVNELFRPMQQQVYFPKETVITVRKYSLTPFFEEYLRALLLETQWSGSLFDVEHGKVPTNIVGGALGFFTACSVTEKVFVVQ